MSVPTVRIRTPLPVIGRDERLTREFLLLVQAREERRLRRAAFWLGFRSMFSVDGWKKRMKERRLIINLYPTKENE